MLFNSYVFIFLFLPITLYIFYFIGKIGHHRVAISWLVLSSLFFYAWWNPAYLYLLLFSMLFNYGCGVALASKGKQQYRKITLIVGISLNILLLGYFKYANFFVGQINSIVGTSFHLETIILPLAISFFTFQQISYLVDAYRHETQEYSFLHYCLFVTFFPQLIAGPIVHHKEMLPQFSQNKIYLVNPKYLSIGLLIFITGLFKKVIIADNLALYANPVFNSNNIDSLTFVSAWVGSLSYTFQLYFDFSGYTDMAIGIAYMFGIKLPINFNSPYKATSIIEFWRRWHITLSRFLRDYIYIALGGNRKGNLRRYVNLFTTMLIGGIWHGAGWTFIIWGVLHGTYLVINHAWLYLRNSILKWQKSPSFIEVSIAFIITFLAVVIGWVYFRAESISTANSILSVMFGANGITVPPFFEPYLRDINQSLNIFHFNGIFGNLWHKLNSSIGWIIAAALIAFFAPNSIQILRFAESYNLVKSKSFVTYSIAISLAIIFVCIVGNLMKVSDFLYFNF